MRPPDATWSHPVRHRRHAGRHGRRRAARARPRVRGAVRRLPGVRVDRVARPHRPADRRGRAARARHRRRAITTGRRFRDSYVAALARRDAARRIPRNGCFLASSPLLDALAPRRAIASSRCSPATSSRRPGSSSNTSISGATSAGAPSATMRPTGTGWCQSRSSAPWHAGHPRVPPERIVVIGDTPRDVECAAAGGARSIAVVATRRRELRRELRARRGAARVVALRRRSSRCVVRRWLRHGDDLIAGAAV